MKDRSQSDNSDYITATDVESSDVASDESWVKTPAKKKVDHTHSRTPTSKGSSNSQRAHETPRMNASVSTPSRRSKTSRKEGNGITAPSPQADPGNSGVKRSHTLPVTPSKTPSSTPVGRIAAVQGAFQKMNINPTSASAPATPSRSKTAPTALKYRTVTIVSSDEEDESEVEVTYSGPPTRPASLHEDNIPTTSSSSQSSMNSLFSTISAESSFSSIGSPTVKDHKSFTPVVVDKMAPRYADELVTSPLPATPEPTVVRDIFHPGKTTTSPNLTTRRKPQKRDPTPAVQVVTVQETSSTEPVVPKAVLRFASSSFGTDLAEEIIAHSNGAQKLFDDNQIAWGVQYELARGVSGGNWTWDDVKLQVPALKGNNAQAAFKVQRLMRLKEAAQPSDMLLWAQLDREQDALKENLGRGLGLMGDYQGVSDWYGGKIQQLGRLVKDGLFYKIKLERMESRRSHRFARFYGSRRFIQVRVSEDLLRQDYVGIRKFLQRKFILNGRVFLPFASKESNIYLVETNENRGRASQDWCGDDFRLSYSTFVNWHNPLKETKNWNQVISKYATRFALGLSNSTPALEFQQENIFFINDLTAADWPKDKKNAPADKLMTDGCGFINHAALLIIVKQNGYQSLPAGVQGRIDGSKGFFILHPSDTSGVPKIWIRDSQNKIKNGGFDRAHRIFDLLAASQPSSSSALTQQSIINLHANGVAGKKLVEMMEQGLEEEVMPLLEWSKPNAMQFLADAISKAGGVPGARAQRVAYSLNRVLGFKGRDWHDDDIGDEADSEEDPVEYTGRNAYSGAPLSLHEIALELIQSGFHPSGNHLLQEKIQYIVKNIIKASVEKYRIPVGQSLGAFIVPDPLGVLKEGEVYYRFSKPRKDPKTEMLCYSLEGEILLGRYPIRLPSDIQKVLAVDRRELDKWPDVLIVSTQGKRSIASLLADGDMDGDEIIGIFDPELVEAFDSKKFTSPPPGFMEDNFDRDVESVEQFCTRVAGLPSRQAHEAFQDVLISNLSESRVGMYSLLHENALVEYGYQHPETIRLAYIFATLLDSSKSGRRLKYGLFERDKRKFGKKWADRSFSGSPSNPSGPSTTTPSGDILGTLQAAGRRKGDELLIKYTALATLGDSYKDPELLKPYTDANDSALAYYHRNIKDHCQELQLLRNHVKTIYANYKEDWRAYFDKQRKEEETPKKKSSKFRKEKKDDVMLDVARKFAEPITFDPTPMWDVEFVKAGFAYELSPKFGFTVAFTTLCLIKARTRGIAPVTRGFDEAKAFSSSYMRALTHAEEDRNDRAKV